MSGWELLRCGGWLRHGVRGRDVLPSWCPRCNHMPGGELLRKRVGCARAMCGDDRRQALGVPCGLRCPESVPGGELLCRYDESDDVSVGELVRGGRVGAHDLHQR